MGVQPVGEIRQQAMLPDINDQLWMVKCRIGSEREAVTTLMRRYPDREGAREPLHLLGHPGAGPQGLHLRRGAQSTHVQAAVKDIDV